MRDGVQKDPIIIDGESATVLDGMHRLAAFRALRIENAVCCLVDYSSRAVTLGRWARVYSAAGGGSFVGMLKEARVTRRTTFAEAFDALEGRDSGLAVLTPESAYLPDAKLDLAGALAVVGGFDRFAEREGWERDFVPVEDVDVQLQAGRRLVVLVMRLGKDDVVAAARTGKLFPCKTSMHHIDPRPVAVNFSIAELGRATSRALEESLRGRRERLLPAGSLYEGRRYKERLLLLNQR